MPAKKSGLKAERKAKPSAEKRAAPAKRMAKTEKLQPTQRPLAKVHPFAKFIKGNQSGWKDMSADYYQEPPRKKAV